MGSRVLPVYCAIDERSLLVKVQAKDGLIWRWIPGFQEFLIPFVLGAVELYLTYSVSLGINYWLVAMAGAALLRGIGYGHMLQRAPEEDETRALLQRVKPQLRFSLFYSIAGALVLGGLAIVHTSGILVSTDQALHGAITLTEPVVALIWVVGAIVGAASYWQRIVEYIRPTKKAVGAATVQARRG